MSELPAIIRSYDPETDYEAVRHNLLEADLYDGRLDTPANLRNAIRDNPDAVLVAELDREVVGNIYLRLGVVPTVGSLAVRVDKRGQGTGELLLKTGLQRLRSRGYETVAVYYASYDPNSARWWAKHGFTVRPEGHPCIRVQRDIHGLSA